MDIPRFWALAEREVEIDEEPLHFRCWRGSDESTDDAGRRAEAAVEEWIARRRRGERLRSYPRDGRPLREEIVEEIGDGRGGRAAVITRNAAGCLVLNTARVMFIDLDFAQQAAAPGAGGFWAWIRRLLLREAPPPRGAPERLLERVRGWHRVRPDWTVRVYRTRAGFRMLVTHELCDPADAANQQLMQSLGADLRYVHLCAAQSCFRARLSPKPWRLRIKRPPARYPWANTDDERRQREWERAYEQRSAAANVAVCELVEVLGDGREQPEAAEIVRVHDGYVLVPGAKRLA